MDGSLYPSVLLEPIRPRGWWTAVFLVLAACVIWWIWYRQETESEEESIDPATQFHQRKRTRNNVKKSIGTMSRREALQAVYIVYADGLEMVSRLGLPEKTLREITILAETDSLAKQEKELFGTLYQPLFQELSAERTPQELLDDVYTLVKHRFDDLVANQEDDE